MIFAEFLALLALAGGGVFAVVAWSKSNRETKRAMFELESALRTRDHRRLDDWMVLNLDKVPAAVRKQVLIRRDEMYIEANK